MPVSRRGTLLLTVALVATLVLTAALAYLLLPPRQAADVAVPAPGAAPEEVVATYLAALDAHDCETARAVVADGGETTAESWCEDVGSLTDVSIQHHRIEDPKHSGRSAREHVAHVSVRFHLDWRPLHGDGSMDEGATTWGYRLVRDSAGSPWRIVDQGVG